MLFWKKNEQIVKLQNELGREEKKLMRKGKNILKNIINTTKEEEQWRK